MANSGPATPQKSVASGRHNLSDASFIFDFWHVLLVVRERWVGALALTLTVCGLTGYTLLSRPPVYSATSALIVDRADRVVDIKTVVDTTEATANDSFLQTHMEQMRSHTFLERVVASLKEEERALILAPYTKPREAGQPAEVVAPTVIASRLEGLVRRLATISNPRRTLLISVTVQHENPLVAQMLANRLCDEYVLHLIDRSSVSNSAALTFLRERSEELRKKVESSELALQNYREKNNLVAVEDNQNIVLTRIKTLSAAVTQARVTRLSLEARLAQVDTMMKGGSEAFNVASLAEFSALAAVQKDIDQLISKRAVLAERYGRRHPEMQDNARSREALEKLRQQHLEAAISDLRNQRERTLVHEKQLEAELAVSEKEALRLEELSVTNNVLRREVETSRQMYSQIFLRQGETAVSSQLRNTNIRIADRADLPKVPISLDKFKIALILALIASAIMIGYPVLSDLADQRIKSWYDVETYLGSLLLAEIGHLKKIPEKDRTQIVAQSQDDPAAELFRALHSQITLTSKLPSPKTLLVTSTVPSEGKSFVACNMAAVFAAHNKRTVLVDCDFRRPSLHRAFQQNNKQGSLRWFNEQGTTADVVGDPLLGIKEVSANLFILRSGGISRRATELIEEPRLLALFEALQRNFDIVVLDTPPAGLFADAEGFARFADEIVYICRFGGANRPHARQVLARLAKTEATVLGVVLNAMPAGRQAESYYYYKYGYSSSKYQKEYYNVQPKEPIA